MLVAGQLILSNYWHEDMCMIRIYVIVPIIAEDGLHRGERCHAGLV